MPELVAPIRAWFSRLRRWVEIRDKCLAYQRELFREGGARVDTSSSSPEFLHAGVQTVIQPDGDILVRLGDGPIDGALLDRHLQNVRQWFQSLQESVTDAVSLARGTIGIVAAVLLAASVRLSFEAFVRDVRTGLMFSIISTAIWLLLVAVGRRFVMRKLGLLT